MIRSSEAERKMLCLFSKVGHDMIMCSWDQTGSPQGQDGSSRGTKEEWYSSAKAWPVRQNYCRCPYVLCLQ